MIRGFSANRLLYAVDGVRMNTAIFRSGNLQNVISLDPFAISKTEVLFGPGSVMYGSDAIGGAMVFETLSPETGDQSCSRKCTHPIFIGLFRTNNSWRFFLRKREMGIPEQCFLL